MNRATYGPANYDRVGRSCDPCALSIIRQHQRNTKAPDRIVAPDGETNQSDALCDQAWQCHADRALLCV